MHVQMQDFSSTFWLNILPRSFSPDVSVNWMLEALKNTPVLLFGVILIYPEQTVRTEHWFTSNAIEWLSVKALFAYFHSDIFFWMYYFPVCFPSRACSFPILSALPVRSWATGCLPHFLSHRCGKVFDLAQKFPAPPGKLAACHAAAGSFKQLLFPRHTLLHLQLRYFLHTSLRPLLSSLPYQKALAMEPCRKNYCTISDSGSLRNYLHVLVYHLVRNMQLYLSLKIFKHCVQTLWATCT